ncbi:hypothetical protein D1D40_24070 [Salmonella enterica]|nr:hypothetical protein [Salmonella enterica]EBJ9131251.1 hypothetical protein [Salmonella enterica]
MYFYTTLESKLGFYLFTKSFLNSGNHINNIIPSNPNIPTKEKIISLAIFSDKQPTILFITIFSPLIKTFQHSILIIIFIDTVGTNTQYINQNHY